MPSPKPLDLSKATDLAARQSAILKRWPSAVLDMTLAPIGEAVRAICGDGDGGASGDPTFAEVARIKGAGDGTWTLAGDRHAYVAPLAWLPTAAQRRAVLAPRECCRYGAPMGRPSWPLPSGLFPAVATRLPLRDGGYDQGGAYWGEPSDLWGVLDAAGRIAYVRAGSAARALQGVCG